MMPTTNQEVRFTPEADRALDELYAKYGSSQSPAQKINILEKILGESHFYATDGDVSDETKLACLEYEWLASQRLIKLELA
jgi:hypothetical protein